MATRNSEATFSTEDNVEIYPAKALPDLLPKTDYLVAALPHTPKTEGLLGKKELSMLPRDAIVVNIGRGAIINQSALFIALQTRSIAAAGIDVWYNYSKDEEARLHTQPADFPFYELDNIVMSPHRAGGLNTDDTERLRMTHLAVLLNAAAQGKEMPNRVNREKGY